MRELVLRLFLCFYVNVTQLSEGGGGGGRGQGYFRDAVICFFLCPVNRDLIKNTVT